MSEEDFDAEINLKDGIIKELREDIALLERKLELCKKQRNDLIQAVHPIYVMNESEYDKQLEELK